MVEDAQKNIAPLNRQELRLASMDGQSIRLVTLAKPTVFPVGSYISYDTSVYLSLVVLST